MPPRGGAAPIQPEDQEWDRLATFLNRRGIQHLAPRRRSAAATPTDDRLYELLLASRNVRLQEAAVLLLLTYPATAVAFRAAVGRLDGVQQDRARRRYVAAAALQRMWRTRLATDLGPQPLIPPAYIEELRLPPLEQDFGRTTLLGLAEREEAEYGYDAWAGYGSLMDLFLGEVGFQRWGAAYPKAG